MQQTLSLEAKSPGKMYHWINNYNIVDIVTVLTGETSTGIGIRLGHFKEGDVKVETWKMNRN